MDLLPPSDVYEKELSYMPYRTSLQRVLEIVCTQAPHKGTVLDLMCGPGYLLGKIAEKRGDLKLIGVDIDEGFITHAKEKYLNLSFEVGDVKLWTPQSHYDVVLCTGALHHLRYEDQAPFIHHMVSMMHKGGLGILSDCYIDDYANETERKLAAARLGYEYLRETISNGAPEDVVEATAQILANDIMMREFKTSLRKRLSSLHAAFSIVDTVKTWPTQETEYGDYIHVLRG